MIRKTIIVVLLSVAGSLALFPGSSRARDVGQIITRCNPGQDITFAELSRQARVTTGGTGTFHMNGRILGFHWYCGGVREYVGNSRLFNAVRVSRAGDMIIWTFRELPPRGFEGVFVGKTYDACDSHLPVGIRGMFGNNLISPREIRVIELGFLTRRVSWRCGTLEEFFANDIPFSRIVVGRAQNGALEMQFFTSPSAKTARTGRYANAAQNDLSVASTSGIFPPTSGAVLLPALNTVWTAQLPAIRRDVRTGLLGFPGVLRPVTVSISGPANATLRMSSTPGEVRLKYVVRDNRFRARFKAKDPLPDTIYNGTFDIEIVLSLPRNTPALGNTPITPSIFVNKVEISGGGLTAFVAANRVRAAESAFATVTPNIRAAVMTTVGNLIGNAPGVPAVPNLPATLAVSGGLLDVCVNTGPGVCPPASPRVSAIALRKVGTRGERCGRSLAWFWDNERAEYVSVAKGRRRTIWIANSLVPWACGDAAGPDFFNGRESTDGPDISHMLTVSRAPTGDRIGFEFLD